MTMGTFARHIAVGQKLPGLLIIQLHGRTFHKLTLVIKSAEEFARHGMMCIRSSTRIYIERYAQTGH